MRRAVLLLALATGAPLSAHADTITYDFTVTANAGSLAGTVASGSLSFDSSLLAAPSTNYTEPDMLSALSFTWNGATFSTATASALQISTNAAGGFGGIVFGDACAAGTCSVSSANPNDWFMGFGFDAAPGSHGSIFVYADAAGSYVSYDVTSSLVTPLPEGSWLLLSGLGLLAVAFSLRREHLMSISQAVPA